MGWIITKFAITAALIVLISEVVKRSDKLGALIAALPLVTVLAMLWMYIEKQPMDKISQHASLTFWYVIPTLPMFLLIPWLLPKVGFWWALSAGATTTMLSFAIVAFVAGRFGIELW
ncbi:DUF3147 family protein [Salinibius halmophilus]|uniref:DUF3147 family protein n=1 Tax=Salinibius halmophilus TaxID=1853216 RepID=UPI000E663908|nr:DUF3147 family protein [Salinibius halmophilus]